MNPDLQHADLPNYSEWLGISLTSPTLHWYELLSLPVFEANSEAIAHAADRALSRVRSHRPGARAASWARLLDDLTTAKKVLLDPASKASYDQALRVQLLNGGSPANAPQTGNIAATNSASQAIDPNLYPPGVFPTHPMTPTAMPLAAAAPLDPMAPAPLSYPASGYPASGYPASGYPLTGNPSSLDPMAPATPASAIPTAPAAPVARIVSSPRSSPGYGPTGQTLGATGAYAPVSYDSSSQALASSPSPVFTGQPMPVAGYGYAQHTSQPSPTNLLAGPIEHPTGPAASTPAGRSAHDHAAQLYGDDSSLPQVRSARRGPARTATIGAILITLICFGGLIASLQFGKVSESQTATGETIPKSASTPPAPERRPAPNATTPSAYSKKTAANQSAANKSPAQTNSKSTTTKQPDANAPAADDQSKENSDTETSSSEKQAETMNSEEMPGPEMPGPDMTKPDMTDSSTSTTPDSEPSPANDTAAPTSTTKSPLKPKGTPKSESSETPGPQPTREEISQVVSAMKSARESLSDSEVNLARKQLAAVKSLPKTAMHEQQFERLSRLIDYNANFQSLLEKALGSFRGGSELKIGNTYISIVEINDELVIIRAVGMNKRYRRHEIPPKLALVFVETAIKEEPAVLLAKGAYILSRDNPPEELRTKALDGLTKAAATNAEEVDSLLPVFEDKYELGQPATDDNS